MKKIYIEDKVITGFFTQPVIKTDSIVIFIHGLLSSPNHPLFEDVAKELIKNSFSTFRINLYAEQDALHPLEESSFTDQAKQIKGALDYFKKEYKKVFLVSHSLGAYLSLLPNGIKIDGLIMYEPSLHPKKIFGQLFFDSKKDAWFDPQINQCVSKDIQKELTNLSSVKSLMKKITCPVGIVTAERGGERVAREYAEHAPNLVESTLVKDADHNFSTKKQKKDVVDITISFLTKMKKASYTNVKTPFKLHSSLGEQVA